MKNPEWYMTLPETEDPNPPKDVVIKDMYITPLG